MPWISVAVQQCWMCSWRQDEMQSTIKSLKRSVMGLESDSKTLKKQMTWSKAPPGSFNPNHHSGSSFPFIYFESCSQEKQKLLKRAIKAERGEQAQKWWLGIVFEMWRSLLVGKVDMLCSCCWHCVLGHTSTWPGLFKTRYPVSTNISREAELQALPERWCSGFKLFFFTLLMVQHQYGLAGKMEIQISLWLQALREELGRVYANLQAAGGEGSVMIGQESRVACMAGEELHPATEEFYNPWWSRWTSRGRGSGWGLGVLHIPCENLFARQRDATKSQDRPDAPAPFEPFLNWHFKSVMIGLNLCVHFHCFRGKTKDYNSCNREEHLTLCGPWTWLSLSPCAGFFGCSMLRLIKDDPESVETKSRSCARKSLGCLVSNFSNNEPHHMVRLWVWGPPCWYLHFWVFDPKAWIVACSTEMGWSQEAQVRRMLYGGACYFVASWGATALTSSWENWENGSVSLQEIPQLSEHCAMCTLDEHHCGHILEYTPPNPTTVLVLVFVMGWFLHRIYGQLAFHEYACGKRMCTCTSISVMPVRYLAHNEIVFSETNKNTLFILSSNVD